jgi:hypothetical protein
MSETENTALILISLSFKLSAKFYFHLRRCSISYIEIILYQIILIRSLLNSVAKYDCYRIKITSVLNIRHFNRPSNFIIYFKAIYFFIYVKICIYKWNKQDQIWKINSFQCMIGTCGLWSLTIMSCAVNDFESFLLTCVHSLHISISIFLSSSVQLFYAILVDDWRSTVFRALSPLKILFMLTRMRLNLTLKNIRTILFTLRLVW